MHRCGPSTAQYAHSGKVIGMIDWPKLTLLGVFGALSLSVCAFGQPKAGNADWPVDQHDVALTGTTTAKGKITSPRVKWEYYLGIPPTDLVGADAPGSGGLVDLDGDGILERYAIDGKTIRVFG